jgi:hypothetical protein
MGTVGTVPRKGESAMTSKLRQILTAVTAFLALLGATRAALTFGIGEPLAAARGHACTHHALACPAK